jgi:hypothetical protein
MQTLEQLEDLAEEMVKDRSHPLFEWAERVAFARIELENSLLDLECALHGCDPTAR